MPATIDPITQLSFAIYESKGVFAVLLGSGLSRAAEIPTGWEITVDLIRRVALAQGIKDQSDWAAWYRETSAEEPNYSKLLGALATSPEERRAIMHRYIEPTQHDREEQKKMPTAAHYAIADLVATGYIRVLITTNFDRLMENALRERGIEPTVIASVDALSGAEPITHSTCYILKLHGDYKDARILNTDDELSRYPSSYDALLDRIFDEYGLIVCGWSGEWDHALRAALVRAPNRRYPMYWAAKGTPGTGAESIIAHRRGRVIPISDANSFFSSLRLRVETLSQTQQQNPASIDLLVNTTKRFLMKPEYRIQLDALFSEETDKLLTKLDGPELARPAAWGGDVFRAYATRYEAATDALATMCGALGRWGNGDEEALVQDVINSLYAHAQKVGDGFTSYLAMRSYPAVLIFTTYGLGLTRAERWNSLHRLFTSMIGRDHDGTIRAVDALFLTSWNGASQEMWHCIEGLEKHRTPLSDHLLTILSTSSKRFIGLTPNLELVHERFEMLGSLAFLERKVKQEIQDSLASDPRQGWTWMPVGRSGWHEVYAKQLLDEISSEKQRSALMSAGFGRGDPDMIDLFVKNFRRLASRMRWS